MVQSGTYESTLYSVGHGTRTAEAFVSLLGSFAIQHLVDIRSHPGSRRYPHFDQEPLRESVGQAGISYTWFSALGGLRREGLGSNSPHRALTSPGFRNYADHMDSTAFTAAVKQLLRLAGVGLTCFMCAETTPQRCHRLLLSDYLFVQRVQVIHILGIGKSTPHYLSPWATVRQRRLIYDVPCSRQLELKLP